MIQGENVSTAEDTVPCGTFLPFGGVIMRFNNGSLEEEEEEAAEVLLLPTFSAAAQARVVITLMLCVVSTICNGAVLWAGLARHQAKHSHARILLLHLAGADLLVALVVMPLDAAWNVTVQWWAGDLACRLLMFLKLFAMYASAFITTLISLDRHAAILHPLAITEARRRNQMVLHVAWLLSACLSFPQLFLFHTVRISSPQNFTQCTTRGSFAHRWHETAYNMLSFLCLFLLPLLVMVACYAKILLEISHRMAPPSSLSTKELPLRRSSNPIPRARLRMLCLSVAIVGSFVVCWTPYYLLGLWYWFWPATMEGVVSHSLAHILFIFGLLNACLDPIFYGLFSMPFPWRLGGCCRGGGLVVARSLPRSSITGSFHCSASSIRVRRGALPLDVVAKTARSPRAWSKDPADSSCL